jgi:hypothetical protein
LHKTLVGLVATMALAMPAAALADSPNTTQTFDCGDGFHTLTLTGSKTLWPPNHKFRSYTVGAQSTNPADFNSTITSAVTVNELATGKGSGGPNHADYASPNPAMGSSSSSGDVSTQQSLRAERDGFGSGRVYTFNVMATWDDGLESCNGTFTVSVPHDQRA